ncbi:MAG: isopentenyl-diphosphate Delta-isomerase [Gemmatimonadota bacterium]
MEEEVVLVDVRDNQLGTAPKLQAHREGRLHRAISVFLFNPAGEMLLQRRAGGKYHSAGLWSNACCSHPRPGEQPHAAAIRRLQEEMGIAAPLDYAFSFVYKAELESGLWEHELDHVFVGTSTEIPSPDASEVGEWRWTSVDEVEAELEREPSSFTVWFPLAFRELRRRTGGR